MEDAVLPVDAAAIELPDAVRAQAAPARGAAIGEHRVGVAAVMERAVDIGREFRGGEHVYLAHHFGEPGREVHLHLTSARGRSSLFRRDDDDAVRAARSVDRGRRCILENLDRLDVRRCERRERVRRGHRREARLRAAERELGDPARPDRDAVDHVERLVVARRRRDATDLHRDAAAWRRIGVRDDDTGHAALQPLLHAGERRLLQLDRRHR